MYQQPRVQDLNPAQRERFNELRKMINMGFLPAGMVSPALLVAHNQVNPDVAKLTHPNDKVNLQSLALMYMTEGVDARRQMLDATRLPRVNDIDLDSSTTLRKPVEVIEDPMPVKRSNVRIINMSSPPPSRRDRAGEAFDDTFEKQGHL